jgi:hypothetical protein
LEGLTDLPKKGRTPILTIEEQAKAVEIGLKIRDFRTVSSMKSNAKRASKSATIRSKDWSKKRLHLEKN